MKMIYNKNNIAITETDEEKHFFSYNTLIATYDKKTEIVIIYHDLNDNKIFTQSTTKQFYFFLNNYTTIYLEQNKRNELVKCIEKGEIIQSKELK